jgi:hypothetical protein
MCYPMRAVFLYSAQIFKRFQDISMLRGAICMIASVGLLTACSPAQNTALALHPPASPFTALLLVDGVSVINTGKTMEDHVASWVTGEDCSLIRASHGYDYCENTKPPPSVAQTTYCYKSLARVSCFDRKLASDAEVYVGSRVDQIPVQAQ